MLGLVLGIAFGVLFVVAVVALYIWTRRSERDIEIPTRELTEQEKHANIVLGGAASNMIGGMSSGGGGV